MGVLSCQAIALPSTEQMVVLNECRNPEGTKKVLVSGSLRNAFSSIVLKGSVRMESKPCSQCATAWLKKGILTPWFKQKWISFDPFSVNSESLCNQATKYYACQVWVNSSNWYPIPTLESPGLTPTTDSESTLSLGKQNLEEKTPPCQATKAVYITTLLNGWRTAGWITWCPLLKAVKAVVTQCTPWHGQWTSNRRHKCLTWVYSKGLQWCKPHWLNSHCWNQHPHWNLKAKSRHQTPTWNDWWVAELWKKMTWGRPMA